MSVQKEYCSVSILALSYLRLLCLKPDSTNIRSVSIQTAMFMFVFFVHVSHREAMLTPSRFRDDAARRFEINVF